MLRDLQLEVGKWSFKNFGHQASKMTGCHLHEIAPLLGMMEELGELVHCVLKRHQGIRGYLDEDKYTTEVADALGDIMIYMMDFCHRAGFDLAQCTQETFDRVVSKRDWKESPEDADKPRRVE